MFLYEDSTAPCCNFLRTHRPVVDANIVDKARAKGAIFIQLQKSNITEANSPLSGAEKNVKSVYDKAISMKYRWAEGDAGHLLGEVYLAKGDKVKARKQLEKAVKCRKEISDPNVEETEKLLERI